MVVGLPLRACSFTCRFGKQENNEAVLYDLNNFLFLPLLKEDYHCLRVDRITCNKMILYDKQILVYVVS